ncbi:Transcription factor Dp-2, partial [Thoreauomyces humboldtii]
MGGGQSALQQRQSFCTFRPSATYSQQGGPYGGSQPYQQILSLDRPYSGQRRASDREKATTAVAAEGDGDVMGSASSVLSHDLEGTGRAPGDGGPNLDPAKRVKGLRHFSKCVADKVETKGTTTYNEVADELVEEFTAEARTADSFDNKNIRRRVYDALNVLMAMGIIVKDKKEIKWTGLPIEGGCQRDLESLQTRNRELHIATQMERVAVESRLQKQRLLKSLVNRNTSRPTHQDLTSATATTASTGTGSLADQLQLPFLLLRSVPDASVTIDSNDDGTQFIVNFSKPFDMIDDLDIVGMLFGLPSDGDGHMAPAVPTEGQPRNPQRVDEMESPPDFFPGLGRSQAES